MEKEYDEMIQAASHYPQASTVCSQQQHDSAITEDERITIRLSPARRTDNDPTARESFYISEETVSQIDLDSLSANDQVLIETTRSIYVFTIIDPVAISGRLIGGVLGNQIVDAYLLPSYVKSGDSTITHKTIKAGVKFTFVIEASKGIQRLTTSSVNSLLHKKRARPATTLKRLPRVTLEQVSD